MGVKIDIARLAASPSVQVSANAYKRPLGQVICPSAGCLCPLDHIPETTRQLENRAIQVHAYFRKAKRKEHNRHCRFFTERHIEKIVAFSRPLDGAEGIFESLKQGHLKYRLHILTEALDVLQKNGGVFGQEDDAKLVGRRYIRNGQLLLPYLRRAKAILALMARVDDRKELASLISIQDDGTNLSWNNFFYRYEDYGRLYKRLMQGPLTHPVAIVVHANREYKPDVKDRKYNISCWFEPAMRRGIRFNIQPRLQTLEPKISERLMKSGESLVCGVPRLRDFKPASLEMTNTNKHPFARIVFEIFSFNQICKFRSSEAQSD